MKARGLDEGVAGQEPERGQKEAGRRRMEREEVLGWGQLVALQAGEPGFCSESGHRWRDFDRSEMNQRLVNRDDDCIQL